MIEPHRLQASFQAVMLCVLLYEGGDLWILASMNID